LRKSCEEYFANYNFADYQQFFEQCVEIQGESDRRNHNKIYLSSRAVEVLIALANRDSDLYVEVLKYYLNLGDPLKLNDLRPVDRLIQICGVEKAHEFLNQLDYPSRREWLFGFYRLLPQEEITVEYLDQLYDLYRNSAPGEMPHDLNFLLKYHPLDENVVVRVVEIILEKIAEDSNYSYALSLLFNPYADINKALLDLFKNHLDLLKQAYLAALKTDWDTDHDGQTFAYILELDPDFIIEYVNWMDERKEQSHYFDDTRDYSFLWKHDNYEELMSQVVERVYEQEQEQFILSYTSVRKFFIITADAKDNALLQERQDHLLKRFIKYRHQDIEFMQFVFSVIGQFSYERRCQFIALFLEGNKKFEDFKKLPLKPNSWSWQGSAVPMYQSLAEYFESLLPLLNTVDFLQHKQYVEQYIQWLREVIEQEKKKDFIEG
jgi:hypothetical protein